MKQIYVKIIFPDPIMNIILTLWYAYIVLAITAGILLYVDNLKIYIANRRRWVKNKHLITYALISFIPCMAGGFFWFTFLEYPKMKQ